MNDTQNQLVLQYGKILQYQKADKCWMSLQFDGIPVGKDEDGEPIMQFFVRKTSIEDIVQYIANDVRKVAIAPLTNAEDEDDVAYFLPDVNFAYSIKQIYADDDVIWFVIDHQQFGRSE